MDCKVYLTNPKAKDVPFIEKALHLRKEDKERYSLIWDDERPDVLLVSECIFYDSTEMKKFGELYNKAGICVFFPGECIAPDLNIFDYGISFSGYNNMDDRVVRMPLRLFFSEYISEYSNPIKSPEQAFNILQQKKGFCNFIYSNPNGHSKRKEIFDIVSTYKAVDSYGSFLNNMGYIESGGSDPTSLVRQSIEIKSGYKFSIAAENAFFPGYTSEKLFTSLEAGTIPIYWGNPEVGNDVNTDAFLNCQDYNSIEEIVDRIKEIDRNDDIWCDIISRPWLTDSQLKKEIENTEKYYDFLNRIFCFNSPDYRRRPSGMWPDIYQNFWTGSSHVSDKYRMYFNIVSSLCHTLQSGKHIYNKLTADVNTVSIYGMGDIGRIIYNDFKQCNNIVIPFCIDNRSSLSDLGVECVRLSECISRDIPDLIIVTVPTEYDNIKKSLSKIFNSKIISVVDLLD